MRIPNVNEMLFLHLPAVKGRQWEYAFARMSDFRLKVTHGDKTVWEVAPEGYDNPRIPYYCTTVEIRKTAEED